MHIASCPLRISLFGGSTDNPYFVEKYGYGSVISFTSNLKTYVTLSQDVAGFNKKEHKYIINYSKREEVKDINLIKNELVKIVLDYFKIYPSTISLTSDIYSHGTGLASSSSYIISLIKAISIHEKINMTDAEICKLAYQLELKLNPYCGYQDPYGCGIGGFKKMEFYNDESIKYEFLPTEIFDIYDMHLVFTKITRNSKMVLKNISGNLDKIYPLLETVDLAYKSLIQRNYNEFINLFNESWIQKKNTSEIITENNIIKKMDIELKNNETVLAHKLCGAGNGGFFLVFSNKNNLNIPYECVKISMSTNGVEGKGL